MFEGKQTLISKLLALIKEDAAERQVDIYALTIKEYLDRFKYEMPMPILEGIVSIFNEWIQASVECNDRIIDELTEIVENKSKVTV